MSKTRGIRKANATDVVFDAGIQGEAYPRIEIHANGTIWTGNGTVAPNIQQVPAVIPGTPGTPVATVASNTSVSLTWTAATGSGITSYVVTPYIGSTAQTTITFGNVLTGTVTGLTTGTAYTFKVHAVNNVGAGPDSAASNSVTPASVPGAPTIGTATAGDAQCSITFTPPGSNGGSAITGYTATSTPGSVTGSSSSSPVVVAGLTNGTAYTFTVHATNAVGNSAESAASNSATPTGAAFSPASLGSKLKVYLEADTIAQSDNTAVSAWNSISPGTFNASQATSGNQPTYQTNEINSLAIVRFVTDDFMSLGTSTIISETTGSEFTAFFVVKIPSNLSEQFIVARDDATLGRDFAIGRSGNTLPYEEGGGAILVNGTSQSDAYMYFTLDAVAGGVHTSYVNGTQTATQGSAGLGGAATGETDIGRRSYSGSPKFATMDLAAIYLCTPRCTSGQITQMHTYIAAKYAL